MLSGKLFRESRQLRESYLEISNYARNYSRISVKNRSRCLYTPAPRINVPTRSRSSKTRGGDVTKGFPLPPGSGIVLDIPELNRAGNKGVPIPPGDSASLDPEPLEDEDADAMAAGLTNADLPSSVNDVFKSFKNQRHLIANPFSWDTLASTSPSNTPTPVKIYGYITSQRRVKGAVFLQLVDPNLRRSIQVVFDTSRTAVEDENGSFSQRRNTEDASQLEGVDLSEIRATKVPRETGQTNSPGHSGDQKPEQTFLLQWLRPHTPVLIEGYILPRAPPRNAPSNGEDTESLKAPYADLKEPPSKIAHGILNRRITSIDPYVGGVEKISHVEIRADRISRLNNVRGALSQAQNGHNFAPEQRQIQFRSDSSLRESIQLRSKAMALSRDFFITNGFSEIETPLLFKSTPEGAREFIVPSRKPAMVYALPQSPQQYKQILMASGFSRYFQFAKCFRDEDMRADRQPEFTQLDLEMSFTGREDVMTTIERFLAQCIWPGLGQFHPFNSELTNDPSLETSDSPLQNKLYFPQLTYHEAMTSFGSDKPDLRFDSKIHQIQDWIPANMKKMITDLDDPIVEMIKIHMEGLEPEESVLFAGKFMDARSSAVYRENPAGIPGIAVYDTKKPLNGLASFGHDGASNAEELLSPQPGDVLVVQARQRAPFSGGSTPLGNLRREMNQAAVTEGLRQPPGEDSFLWVTDFPLFSPADEGEPGQGGSAGIRSTHHPFTAPRADQDLMKLYTDPLGIIGDHYDLVINGVEVGGGSVRIHRGDMQALIFRDVLKMRPDQIALFKHLLNALEGGCPPHAGFALGFDRLMTLALRKESVRDVIAFPKDGVGEDKMVGSPSATSREVLKTYHLRLDRGRQIVI